MKFESIAYLGLGLNQLEYIQAAKDLGYYIIGFDGDKNAVCKNLCDVSYRIRIDNHPKIVDELKAYENLIGCVSEQTDNALMSVGVVNSVFNLLGPSLELVKSIKQKFHQRLRCRELKVNQPDFIFYDLRQDFSAVAEKFVKKYQNLVIKPCEGQSSIGVISIAREALLNCNSADLFHDLSETSGTNSFLIEEFVNGSDISIEGFVYKSKITVLAICHKTKFENNPMVDKALIVAPYEVNKHKLEYQLTDQLVKGFDLNNGFFHIEAKKIGNSLSLIEWTPRGCGARLSSILLSKMYDENIPRIRVGMLKNNYQLPKLRYPENVGLLQFFESEITDLESLHTNIKKYVTRYILCLDYFDIKNVLIKKNPILDGRSRPGNIIAIGTKETIQSLSTQLSIFK